MDRQIRVVMDCADDLGPIRADTRKVKQIIYNLLSNALKFTRGRGGVTLRASHVPRAKVGLLSGLRPGRSFLLAPSTFAEFLEISVTDDGIGISPTDWSDCFSRSARLTVALRENSRALASG